MYGFTDVNAAAVPAGLPAEAVCINGKWLDEEIKGFRTLAVSGREVMGKAVEAVEGATDGALYISHRYPPRTLTIKYQITAETPQEYRRAFNGLNRLLIGDLQIICADEPDKYFTGVLSSAGQPEPGQMSCVSEIEIYCADPFKRALEPAKFEAIVNPDGYASYHIEVENRGAYPAPVNIMIKNKRRNAYLGIGCEGRCLQIGDFNEPFETTTSGPQELFDLSRFISAPAYTGTDALHPGHSTSGRLGTVQIIPDGSTEPKTWLALTTKGTATTDGAGCGGVRQVSIPADAAGNTGAKDWKCLFFSWFQNNLATEQGSQSLAFLASDGTIIAAVNVYRSATGQAVAEFSFGSNAQAYFFQSDTNSWLSLGTQGHQHMEKDGGTLKYWYNGKFYTLSDDAMADKVCTAIQLKIGAYQGRPEMTRNYFGSLSFEKKNVIGKKDYPSRYPAGTKIRVDSKAGKVYVGGLYRPDQEQRNSEYPVVQPGKTGLSLQLSPFYPADLDQCEVTAEIEEVYL